MADRRMDSGKSHKTPEHLAPAAGSLSIRHDGQTPPGPIFFIASVQAGGNNRGMLPNLTQSRLCVNR